MVYLATLPVTGHVVRCNVMKYKGRGRKRSWSNLRYGQDLNQASPEYMSEALPFQPSYSIKMFLRETGYKHINWTELTQDKS
jgi:hypothetical protein